MNCPYCGSRRTAKQPNPTGRAELRGLRFCRDCDADWYRSDFE